MLMQKMSSLAHVDAGAAICASIPKRYDGNSSFAWPAVHDDGACWRCLLGPLAPRCCEGSEHSIMHSHAVEQQVCIYASMIALRSAVSCTTHGRIVVSLAKVMFTQHKRSESPRTRAADRIQPVGLRNYSPASLDSSTSTVQSMVEDLQVICFAIWL